MDLKTGLWLICLLVLRKAYTILYLNATRALFPFLMNTHPESARNPGRVLDLFLCGHTGGYMWLCRVGGSRAFGPTWSCVEAYLKSPTGCFQSLGIHWYYTDESPGLESSVPKRSLPAAASRTRSMTGPKTSQVDQCCWFFSSGQGVFVSLDSSCLGKKSYPETMVFTIKIWGVPVKIFPESNPMIVRYPPSPPMDCLTCFVFLCSDCLTEQILGELF